MHNTNIIRTKRETKENNKTANKKIAEIKSHGAQPDADQPDSQPSQPRQAEEGKEAADDEDATKTETDAKTRATAPGSTTS